ncbi:hypothetical protein IF1G_10417 [Cordyceps javanica]|uniref:Uncharacterized protein n=1 Tax=Cordyceps javanica TaxID=43265 RepID=A0A545UN52_9HYPO|nr:hypothetical protein IF1G_10417 [Cordyceps javanica]
MVRVTAYSILPTWPKLADRKNTWQQRLGPLKEDSNKKKEGSQAGMRPHGRFGPFFFSSLACSEQIGLGMPDQTCVISFSAPVGPVNDKLSRERGGSAKQNEVQAFFLWQTRSDQDAGQRLCVLCRGRCAVFVCFDGKRERGGGEGRGLFVRIQGADGRKAIFGGMAAGYVGMSQCRRQSCQVSAMAEVFLRGEATWRARLPLGRRICRQL